MSRVEVGELFLEKPDHIFGHEEHTVSVVNYSSLPLYIEVAINDTHKMGMAVLHKTSFVDTDI